MKHMYPKTVEAAGHFRFLHIQTELQTKIAKRQNSAVKDVYSEFPCIARSLQARKATYKQYKQEDGWRTIATYYFSAERRLEAYREMSRWKIVSFREPVDELRLETWELEKTWSDICRAEGQFWTILGELDHKDRTDHNLLGWWNFCRSLIEECRRDTAFQRWYVFNNLNM
ncbi:hypothetical protein ACOMHN_031544 [Nucella lapillus]